MIVSTIISVLVSGVAVFYGGFTQRSRRTLVRREQTLLRRALDTYYVQFGRYAPTPEALIDAGLVFIDENDASDAGSVYQDQSEDGVFRRTARLAPEYVEIRSGWSPRRNLRALEAWKSKWIFLGRTDGDGGIVDVQPRKER